MSVLFTGRENSKTSIGFRAGQMALIKTVVAMTAADGATETPAKTSATIFGQVPFTSIT